MYHVFIPSLLYLELKTVNWEQFGHQWDKIDSEYKPEI